MSRHLQIDLGLRPSASLKQPTSSFGGSASFIPRRTTCLNTLHYGIVPHDLNARQDLAKLCHISITISIIPFARQAMSSRVLSSTSSTAEARSKSPLNTNEQTGVPDSAASSTKDITTSARKWLGNGAGSSRQTDGGLNEPAQKPHRRKSSQDKPGRPPNAFILYRSAKLKEIAASQHQEGPILQELPKSNLTYQQNLSRQIAERWRNETVDVKELYYAKSAVVACEHKIRYPNYKYQPKRRTTAESELAVPATNSEQGPRSAASSGSKDDSRCIHKDRGLYRVELADGKSKRRVSSEIARAKVSPYPSPVERRTSLEIETKSRTMKPQRQRSISACTVSTTVYDCARSQSSYSNGKKALDHHNRIPNVNTECDTQQRFSSLLPSDSRGICPVPVGIAVSTINTADAATSSSPSRAVANSVPKGLPPSTRQILEASLANRRRGALETQEQKNQDSRMPSQVHDPVSRTSSGTPSPPVQSWEDSIQEQSCEAMAGSAVLTENYGLDAALQTNTWSIYEPGPVMNHNNNYQYGDLASWQLPLPAWLSYEDWLSPPSSGDAIATSSGLCDHGSSCLNIYARLSPCFPIDPALNSPTGQGRSDNDIQQQLGAKEELFPSFSQPSFSQVPAFETEYRHTEKQVQEALSQTTRLQTVGNSFSVNQYSDFHASQQQDQVQPSPTVLASEKHSAESHHGFCLEGFKPHLDPCLSEALFFSPSQSATEPSDMTFDYVSQLHSPLTNFSRPFDLQFEPCSPSHDVSPAGVRPQAEVDHPARASSPTKNSSLKDWSTVHFSNFRGKLSGLRGKTPDL